MWTKRIITKIKKKNTYSSELYIGAGSTQTVPYCDTPSAIWILQPSHTGIFTCLYILPYFYNHSAEALGVKGLDYRLIFVSIKLKNKNKK